MLIIFDCDGVLVDSEVIASAVLAKHLTLAGFPYTSQECMERFAGLSLDSCRVLIEVEAKKTLSEDFFLQVQRETFSRFSEDLKPVVGVIDVLDFVSEHQWSCCVASSGSHEKMALTLKKTGLQKYFSDRIYSATDVQYGKPAPDLFLYAAQSLSYLPEHCVVIEDSKPGVMAALAAGMQVCALGNQHEASADTRIFTRMAELPAILTSLSLARSFH
jgi:phosphoglycolate phosphatase